MVYRRKNNFYFVVTICAMSLMLSACGSTVVKDLRAPSESTISLADQAWVKSGSEAPQMLKKGETITVTTEPVLIEAPGKIGVLVLPAGETKSVTQVQLRDIENWAGDAAQSYAATILSDILVQVNEVQSMISRGRSRDALTKVKTLQAQYPRVAYLKFIEASCLIVLGDRKNARAVLEEALALYPNNAEAQNALRGLAGENSP